MTDVNTQTDDRTVPAVVYALYIIGLTHGLTILIGLIVAYVNRDNASPTARSHCEFLIRTFWLSIGFFVAGLGLFLLGMPMMLVGLGFLMAPLGLALCGLTWLYVLVRCIVGAIHLARGEPYPRPYAILL